MARLKRRSPDLLGIGLAVLLGLAVTAALAPFGAWWAQPLAAGGLWWLVHREPPRRAAWRAWWMGFAWLTSSLWWLVISMHTYGGMPLALAIAALVLLTAWLALWLAAAMAGFAWLAPRGAVGAVLGFAACWLVAELARAQAFTGFPWSASGYAHTDGALAVLAPWVGVYAMGALGALLGAAIVQALVAQRDARRGRHDVAGRAPTLAVAAGLLVLLAAAHALPTGFTRPAGTVTVSLLQPAVPQNLKFDIARLDRDLAWLTDATARARGRIVVQPESVVPLPMALIDPSRWRAMDQAARQRGASVLTGTFLGDEASGYVNAVFALGEGTLTEPGSGYRYGKRHLLPFGEFIPPGFGWFVRALAIPLSDQAAGTSQAPWRVAGQRLRPLICYEDLFGEDIVGSVTGDPQDAATVFVNVSNLAWFGRHVVQDQHLQFSRMRALEFERPFVRSTNTGATAFVDHRGRVTMRMPPEVPGVLEGQVEGRLGVTPYAWWLRAAGLWPLWAACAAVLLPLAWAARRRRATP